MEQDVFLIVVCGTGTVLLGMGVWSWARYKDRGR